MAGFKPYKSPVVKDPILCVFSARKVDILPLNSNFRVKIWPSESGHFDHFQGQKTRFLDFLKVGLEFRSLGIILALKA